MITVTQSNTHKIHFNGNVELPKLQSTISKETYHHSDSNSSKNSIGSIEVQHLSDALDNSKCSYGIEGLNLCSNPHCQNNAVICFKKNCQCKENHKNCSNALFNGFLNRYEMKLKDEKTSIEKVQTIFQKLIDQISQMEDQIIKSIRGSFLTFSQSQFILKLQNQDFSSLKGKQIAEVFSYLNQSNQVKTYTKFVDSLIEDIEQMSKQSIESFKKIQILLQKQVNSKNVKKQQKQQTSNIVFEKEIENNIDSQILTDQQQVQTLKQFFTNKFVKEMKLLYRASENKFSMEKFYEKCSNIPNTLIVMKTEFDKIIGGYTPLTWKKYEGVIKNRLQDPSLESFVFSVSQKEKLQLTEKENATYYLSYAPGPRFGKQGCADLWICDQSNTKADSYVLGNMSYNNPKYSSNEESYQKFIGAPTQYFKTKEWEVFQVKFE